MISIHARNEVGLPDSSTAKPWKTSKQNILLSSIERVSTPMNLTAKLPISSLLRRKYQVRQPQSTDSQQNTRRKKKENPH
jgi:hypothetical protein